MFVNRRMAKYLWHNLKWNIKDNINEQAIVINMNVLFSHSLY